MHYTKRMKTGRPIKQRSDIAERFAAVLGESKLAEKFGVLFGVGRRVFYKWEQQLEYPTYVITVLELLERLPRDQWPVKMSADLSQFDPPSQET